MTLVPDAFSSVAWRGLGGVGVDGSPSCQWTIWGLQWLFGLVWEVRKLLHSTLNDFAFFFIWPPPHDLWDFSSLIGDWTWALGSESLGLTGLPGNTIFKNTVFKKLYILYWGIADKQYCGSFRWTVKRLSHTYPFLLIYSFSETFAHLPQLFCWWEEKWFMVTAVLPDDFRSGTDMPVKNV